MGPADTIQNTLRRLTVHSCHFIGPEFYWISGYGFPIWIRIQAPKLLFMKVQAPFSTGKNLFVWFRISKTIGMDTDSQTFGPFVYGSTNICLSMELSGTSTH
jgi:hypothetical protein